jgi:pectin methylesterase-like acyl-CoA thioesterase
MLATLLTSMITVGSAPVARAVSTTHYVAASGPVGDGSSCAQPGYVGADHTPIAAAVAAASAGDTVLICAGEYSIGTTIVVDKTLTLQGAGAQHSVLSGGGTKRIMLTSSSALTEGSLFSVTVSSL